MKDSRKRLFWGFSFSSIRFSRGNTEIVLPDDGRKIKSDSRHATCVFLGNIAASSLEDYIRRGLLKIPERGLTGIIDNMLFLPSKKKPRVAAATGLLSNRNNATEIVESLKQQMISIGYRVEKRPWLFHITLARAPFKVHGWSKIEPIEIFTVDSLNLYESLPNLTYRPLYTQKLSLPWEYGEEDSGGVKFNIRGMCYREIFFNTLISFIHFAFTRKFKFSEKMLFSFSDEIRNQQLRISNSEDVVVNVERFFSGFEAMKSYKSFFKEISNVPGPFDLHQELLIVKA